MTSITIVNPFEVPEESIEKAIESWDAFESFFTKQKGYISAKLLRSHDTSSKFNLVTIAEWDTKENFEAAIANPELALIAAEQPEFTRYPASYDTIRNV